MNILNDTSLFVAVIQQGGFSHAAKHLGLSNGLISRRIANDRIFWESRVFLPVANGPQTWIDTFAFLSQRSNWRSVLSDNRERGRRVAHGAPSLDTDVTN